MIDIGFWDCLAISFGLTFGVTLGMTVGKLVLFAVRYIVLEYTGLPLDRNG